MDILNSHIPGEAFKVDNSCLRLQSRLKAEVSKARAQLKKLNRGGSKQQRENFNNSWRKLAILNSDIVTAEQWQGKINCLENKKTALEEVNCELENEVENWKRQYDNLEESTQILFEEMMEELQREIDIEKEGNKRMETQIKQLERGGVSRRLTSLEAVSGRQKKRRISEFSSKAQKALWFSEAFGFHPDSMHVTDDHANRYNIALKQDSQPTNIQATTQVSSGPATKHYEQLTNDEKAKVESLLYLVDKFGVSNKFVHEMAMVFEDLPRSYLVKECRHKIDSGCVISPIPGSCPGAQVSFKEKLANKLKTLVCSRTSFMTYVKIYENYHQNIVVGIYLKGGWFEIKSFLNSIT